MRSLFFKMMLGSLLALSARGENLLENGSFEQPTVTGRTPENAGGNPAQGAGKTRWKSFTVSPETEEGRLVAGLTNEIARTGPQSLYLDFQKVTAPLRHAILTTELIPVKAQQTYRVSLWGRVDRKRPLALDERRPQLWVEIEFLKADQTTEAGDSIRGAQLLPGLIVPAGRHELLFVSNRWKESFALASTPEETAFLRVTWSWNTPVDAGETDGIIYWDDASIAEEALLLPPPAEEPKQAAPAGIPSGTAAPGDPAAANPPSPAGQAPQER